MHVVFPKVVQVGTARNSEADAGLTVACAVPRTAIDPGLRLDRVRDLIGREAGVACQGDLLLPGQVNERAVGQVSVDPKSLAAASRTVRRDRLEGGLRSDPVVLSSIDAQKVLEAGITDRLVRATIAGRTDSVEARSDHGSRVHAPHLVHMAQGLAVVHPAETECTLIMGVTNRLEIREAMRIAGRSTVAQDSVVVTVNSVIISLPITLDMGPSLGIMDHSLGTMDHSLGIINLAHTVRTVDLATDRNLGTDHSSAIISRCIVMDTSDITAGGIGTTGTPTTIIPMIRGTFPITRGTWGVVPHWVAVDLAEAHHMPDTDLSGSVRRPVDLMQATWRYRSTRTKRGRSARTKC